MSSRRACIYVRISSDDGSALGVERQRQDCALLAATLGWDVAKAFIDNDVSAFSGKTRPAYERMLAALEAGTYDALVVWDTDRLTRQPIELEHIINLAERRGLELACVGGDIDLATPQGRLTARIKGSVARHEVEQQSRRIKRKTLERAEVGKPHGKVAYGWVRVNGHDEIHPEQAAIVREAARRVLAGESLRSIHIDFEQRRVPTPRGLDSLVHSVVRRLDTESIETIAADLHTRGGALDETTALVCDIAALADEGATAAEIAQVLRRADTQIPLGLDGWRSVTIRQLLLRERNAGYRVHQDKRFGVGNWEPILSEDVYDRLVAVLTDPNRRCNGNATRFRHLLSGIARCGRCEAPMRVLAGTKTRPRPYGYSCPRCFGVRRVQVPTDKLVEDHIIARLSRPDAMLALMPDTEDAHALIEEAAVLRARLNLAADQYGDDQIDGEQLARITAKLKPQLVALEERIKATSVAPDLSDLASPDIGKRWASLPLARRRAVIDLMVTVRILPFDEHLSNAFHDESVEIRRRKRA